MFTTLIQVGRMRRAVSYFWVFPKNTLWLRTYDQRPKYLSVFIDLNICWVINVVRLTSIVFLFFFFTTHQTAGTESAHDEHKFHFSYTPRRQMVGITWWCMMVSWAPRSTSSPPHWSHGQKELASGSRSWYRDVQESRAMAMLYSPLCFYGASKASKRSPRSSCHKAPSVHACGPCASENKFHIRLPSNTSVMTCKHACESRNRR